MFGIDVSEHNGIINWDIVKSKIDFAILKLGNIGDNKKFWTDPKFERNYNECKRLGIPIGLYVYCYSNELGNAEQAAKNVIEYLKGKSLELPVYIDMEDKEIAPEGKNKLTHIAVTFNTLVEKAGFWAGVYANKNWFNNYLDKAILSEKYTCWVAQYASKCDLNMKNIDIWQNSSTGKIEGIPGNNGNVDTNYMYRDLIAEINGSKLKSNVKKETQNTVSIVDLANDVIKGKYGDGEARRINLGSLYDEVQAKVNEILGYKKETIYVVQPGDILSKIAAKFGTTYQEIAAKNGIANPNLIYPNQKLKI